MDRAARGALLSTVLFVLGLLLLQCAWLVTVPPFDGTDEIDHAFRASELAGGEVLDHRPVLTSQSRRGRLVSVREDIAQAARAPCAVFSPSDSPACRPVRSVGHDRVLIASSAASYDPVGYLPMALASGMARGYGALYAMRIAGLVVCTLLLGVAFHAVRRRTRTPWPMLGLLLTLTPTTLYLTVVAAPTGTNLAAGIALWTLLLAYYRSAAPASGRAGLLTVAGVVAALLASTHSLSLGWLPLVLVGVMFAVGRSLLGQRWRQASGWHIGFVALAAGGWLAAAAWVGLARTNDPRDLTSSGIPLPIFGLFRHLVQWQVEMVAATPTRNDSSPLLTYLLWISVFGVFVVAGLRVASSRDRTNVVALVLMASLVALVLTVLTFDRLGFGWQGRYALPLLAGVPLLLGFALEQAGRPAHRSLLVLAVAALVVPQVLAMAGVVTLTSTTRPWSTGPHWPQPHSVGLVAVAVVVVALWLAALRRTDPS